MATRTLSFQKRARRLFGGWESDYTTSTGSDLLGEEIYAISYKFSPYKGSDVQTINSFAFTAVLGGDWAQECTYKLFLYTKDPAGYDSQPDDYIDNTSGSTMVYDSSTGRYVPRQYFSWNITKYVNSYSEFYILIMVKYGSGQVTLNHGNSSIVESYTAKAIPQISFGTITGTDTGLRIPINNGSNYTLTCTITAGTQSSPGNNAQLYRGTSSNGVFNVPIDAVQWFNTAGITNSLELPITLTVTGGTPSPISTTGTWQEKRQTEIDKMKPVIASLANQIQQAPGGATDYYPNTYIAGYSKTKVTAVITRPTLAEISGVYLNYPGGATVTMEEDENNPGTYTGITAALTKNTEFTVSVIDERSLRNDDTTQVTGVVAYVEPSVSIDLAYRCDDQGVETNGGDHYRIKVTAQINTNLPNNTIEELTVGLEGAPAAERHNITSGTTSSALPPAEAGDTGTLSNPKKAYVLTVIIRDKISDQVLRGYTLKGMQRDLVINHDGGHTHLAVGTTPVGKDMEKYRDTIELPLDGLFLIGGIPVQSFNYPYRGATGQSDNPPFGKDFHNISSDRMGALNATCIFGFPASQYSSWSNVPEDPLDNQSTPSGIRTLGWIGWREVYFASDSIVLVKIVEFAPQAGRVWFCSRTKDSTTHEYRWTQWKYLMPINV